MNDIEKAIMDLKIFDEYMTPIPHKSIQMAIDALYEKQEHDKPCSYIHDIYIEKHYAFCPHCGHKLNANG